MSDTTPDPTPTPAPAVESQAPAAATPEPPKADPEPKKSSPWDDHPEAKAEIERLRRENASSRTNAKATAAEEARKEILETIGKALGREETPVDPAELAKQLTEAQSQARQHALELAIFRAAPDASAANALLDSRSFLAKIADLDPSDSAALAGVVTDAVANIPASGRRTPAPNPAQGTSASGPSSASQLTQQDLDGLAREGKHDEILKHRKDGRFDDLLAGKQ